MVKKNMSFSLKSKDKKKLIIVISVIIGIILGSLFFCSCKNGRQGFTSNQTNQTNQTNQSSNMVAPPTTNNVPPPNSPPNSNSTTHSNQKKPNQHSNQVSPNQITSNQVTSNQTSFTISPTKEGFKMKSLFKKNPSLGANNKKEGFLDKLMKKRKNNSNQASPNQPSLNKEGFSVIQQGPGAGMLSTPLGANINWNTSDGMENMSPYANILQKHKNIKAPDPSTTTEEGALFLFGGNISSPSCCGPNIGSSFSTSDGCLCTSDEQIIYLNERGGNRTLTGDNF